MESYNAVRPVENVYKSSGYTPDAVRYRRFAVPENKDHSDILEESFLERSTDSDHLGTNIDIRA